MFWIYFGLSCSLALTGINWLKQIQSWIILSWRTLSQSWNCSLSHLFFLNRHLHAVSVPNQWNDAINSFSEWLYWFKNGLVTVWLTNRTKWLVSSGQPFIDVETVVQDLSSHPSANCFSIPHSLMVTFYKSFLSLINNYTGKKNSNTILIF